MCVKIGKVKNVASCKENFVLFFIFIFIGLTDVGYNNLHIMEVCSMEAVDQDKDVELAAASDQPVEETTGNMVAMETVSVVAMVEDGDIILDMDTIHQSTFHHRLVIIHILIHNQNKQSLLITKLIDITL